jgi:hypothetical protein
MFQQFSVSPHPATPPWLALESNPMVAFLVMASTEPNATQDRAGLGSLAAFLLHTCVAYTCGLHLYPTTFASGWCFIGSSGACRY